MPVKRIIESMPNQWFTSSAIDLNSIDVKSKSNAINANSEPNNTEDNGYKTALNESVVDDLVSTLTNKLCLKTNHRLCRMSRLSPYQIHSSMYRSQGNNSCYCVNCKYLLNSNTTNSKAGLKRSSSMSDTYELMQQLLKEGSLIKEAVKRLQLEVRSPIEDKKPMDFYDDCSDEEFNENENRFNFLNS